MHQERRELAIWLTPLAGIRYKRYPFEGARLDCCCTCAKSHRGQRDYIRVAATIGTRYALVGDLLWQLDGITLGEERLWITSIRISDAEGTRESLLRMIAIKERLPELIIVPAHDERAFAEMPMLSQASSEAGH